MLDVHVFRDDMNTMAFVDGRKYRDSECKKGDCPWTFIRRDFVAGKRNGNDTVLLLMSIVLTTFILCRNIHNV